MAVIAHPKKAVYRYTGPASVPSDIKELRLKSLEYHRQYGTPIIHKHRWNLVDLQEGRAQRCPFHEEAFGRDTTWDPYCFGTGFLGGWDDGQLVFVTLSDTQEDVYRETETGLLTHERHPGLIAPWTPKMGDGDLILMADFAPNTWEILNTGDRYLVEEVRPTTLRGFESIVQAGRKGEYLIDQRANIDFIPLTEAQYQVPVIFDYSDIPDAPEPPDYDPSEYPEGTKFANISRAITVIAVEPGGFQDAVIREIWLPVAGTEATVNREIFITGKTAGVVIHI